jgi:hypothetical protein
MSAERVSIERWREEHCELRRGELRGRKRALRGGEKSTERGSIERVRKD